jgi:pSer/pThr/pTyr-binding forkhead associated (FHA) protein
MTDVHTDPAEASPARWISAQSIPQALRDGVPFLVFCDGTGREVVQVLQAGAQCLTVGRHACDVCLPWDHGVSATHAVLERLGERWTLVDDGLSRNGTFVNGQRLTLRRRLVDRDQVKVGSTLLTFREPVVGVSATIPEYSSAVALTPMQRKVLVALCRPYKEGGAYLAPASNRTIADELVLSLDAVKSHMRGLFERFEVADLPQNQKRAKVVERAFSTGIVSERDL